MLSRKQMQEILQLSRSKFINANFIDNSGLMIEGVNEIDIHFFCLEVFKKYQEYFGNLDGYEIKKISRKILYNYADRKRKLKLDFFCRLVKENKFNDICTVLAGILYLDPDEVDTILSEFQIEFGILAELENNVLEDIYRSLIMFASSRDRKFSTKSQEN